MIKVKEFLGCWNSKMFQDIGKIRLLKSHNVSDL